MVYGLALPGFESRRHRNGRKTRYRKYAGEGTGAGPGFATPTCKVKIYSQLFLKYGLPPLPDFVKLRKVKVS